MQLGMTRQAKYDLGLSGHIVDRPTPLVRLSSYTYMTGQSIYHIGPSDQVVDHPTPYIGPSGYAYVGKSTLR